MFWVGGTGNFSDSSHWSSTSGGSGGAGVPSAFDNAIFDANSFSADGQIVTIDVNSNCLQIDMSGVTYAITIDFPGGTSLAPRSHITIPSNVSVTYTGTPSNASGILLMGDKFIADPVVINIQSTVFTADIWFSNHLHGSVNSNRVTYSLAANLTARRIGNLFTESFPGYSFRDPFTFNTNNYNIQCSEFAFDPTSISFGFPRSFVVNPGTSVITLINGDTSLGADSIYVANTLAGGNAAWGPMASGGATDNSTFNIQGNGQVTGPLYNLHVIDTTGSFSNNLFINHVFDIYNNGTFDPDTNIVFASGNYFFPDVFTNLSLVGTSGHPITLQSDSPGNQYYINATTASVSYVSVTDAVAGGAAAPFNDIVGGVNGGNNSSWIFPPPPPPPPEVVAVTDITFDSVNVQGRVPSCSGAVDIGIVYATTPAPTISDNHKSVYPSSSCFTGPFFTDIFDLLPGTLYYVRAYVFDGVSYRYGSTTLTFTTLAPTPLLMATDNLIGVYQIEILDGNNNIVMNMTGYAFNLSFVITRNRAEEISFSIPLGQFEQHCADSHVAPTDVLATGINAVRIKRKNQIILAGQIDYWDTNYSDPTRPLIEVKAHGWLSLLSQRLFSGEYISKDANFIIKDMISQTQLLTHGDYGITIGVNAVGSNTYTDKIFEHKNIDQAMIELSEENGGLDFSFTWDKILNMYWPSIGSVRNDILFTLPGNIDSLNVSSDSTKLVNSLFARGRGNGAASVGTIVVDSTSQVKYKLRESVRDFPDVDDDQLLNLAASEAKFYKNPLELHSLTYIGSNTACPEIGTFGIGDSVRIAISGNQLFTSMINDSFKIDKITVSYQDDGVEKVQLDFNNAPA